MRRVIFIIVAIAGVTGGGLLPATATPLSLAGIGGCNVRTTQIEKARHPFHHLPAPPSYSPPVYRSYPRPQGYYPPPRSLYRYPYYGPYLYRYYQHYYAPY